MQSTGSKFVIKNFNANTYVLNPIGTLTVVHGYIYGDKHFGWTLV